MSGRRGPLRLACAAVPLAAGAAVATGCAADVAEARGPLLADATAAAGLDFRHRHGGAGARELPETMGGGVALVDFDGDGDLDLYFAQSGPVRRADRRESRSGARNALYANDGGARFTAVRAAAGAGDPGYGMGCTAGDADGDGRVDLVSLNWGPNRLYRNQGGSFRDASRQAGLAPRDEWSVSAVFFDRDGDGDLDLYVVNYLVCPPGAYARLGEPDGFASYPHPDRFAAAQDRLYVNGGDGRFADATEGSGIVRPGGKGLGVVATDVELDGWVDLYVANDSTPNFLFSNRGGERFVEVAAELGAAYGDDGRSEAGMGVDTADVDDDGDFDLFVTNLDQETNTLYLNGWADGGRAVFEDATLRSGTARASRPLVGFGALFNDVDGDGVLDLLVANGHIIDNIALYSDSEAHAQPNQLFRGTGGGRFEQVPEELAGAGLALPGVSRGTACGDLDGDLDLDYVVATNDGAPQLLLGAPRWRAGLALALEGPPGNRRGLGACVVLELEDGRRLLRRVESARSYASASDPVLVTGLPSPVHAVEVLWPGGRRERWDTAGDAFEGRRTLRWGSGGAPPGGY